MMIATLLAAAMLSASDASAADWLKFADDSVWSDDMVLQREAAIPVWGSCEKGVEAEVTVEFAGQVKRGKTAADGTWEVKLDPLAVSKEPRTLIVTAKAKARDNCRKELKGLLVGDVWLGSGQSNMEFPVWHKERKFFREYSGGLLRQWVGKNNNLRLAMTTPERGIAPGPRYDYPLKWSRATDEYLVKNRFSAIGCYVGRELERTLDIPIGVIVGAWGGTAIEPWVPDCGWEAVQGLPFVVTNTLPRIAVRKETDKAGKRRPWPQYPGDLWNEQMQGFSRLPVKGLIWYQGCSDMEANAKGKLIYHECLRALAAGWRKEFNNPEMPMLLVELAPFSYEWMKDWKEDNPYLSMIRDEQWRFTDIDKHAWITTVSDLGDVNDIHPHRKFEVAMRIAGLALQHVYGMDVLADPPRAVAAKKIDTGKVEITLKNARELFRWMPEVTLWTARKNETSPIRFVDKDGKWYDCESEVKDGKIIAWCEKCPDPKSVTHLRHRIDQANIFNDSTIPLGTFVLEVK